MIRVQAIGVDLEYWAVGWERRGQVVQAWKVVGVTDKLWIVNQEGVDLREIFG